jgi:hypothetical protein
MNLEQAAGVLLCIKIGLPGDEILKEKADHLTQSEDYLVPIYHQRGKIKKVEQQKRPE